MSSFRTPLAWTLGVLAVFLVGLAASGYLRPPKIGLPWPDSQYVFVEGRIARPLARGWALECSRIQDQPVSTRVYLTSVDPRAIILPELASGAPLLIWGRFLPPAKNSLPGGFDLGDYLSREGLGGRLLVDNPSDIKVLGLSRGIRGRLDGWRSRAALLLMSRYPDPRVQGLLSGLLIGDKRLLDPSLNQSFRRAGVMHLLVVSGLHVALWGAMVWFVATRLARLPRRLSGAITLAATWGFALFVGLSAPVLRSAFMASVLLFGSFLRRETPALSRLFLAGLFLLIIKPRWISDASFLLSFMSTFGILYGWGASSARGGEGQARHWMAQRLMALAATGFFAWYALLPFGAAFFHQLPLAGLASNLILVPASSALMGLGLADLLVLSRLGPFDSWSHALVDGAARLFLGITDFFASFPWAILPTAPWDLFLIGAWLSVALTFGLAAAPGAQPGPLRSAQGTGSPWRGRLLILAGILLTSSALAQALRPARLYLLSDGSRYGAALQETGYRRHFCWAAPPENFSAFFRRNLDNFIQSRGMLAARAAVAPPQASRALQSSGAFWDWPIQLKSSCGRTEIIFPLSPFPIIGENVESRILECKRGSFQEVVLTR
ncbi:MAG: ComEC/Rec2 family competence protein [Elusimicrobiota bacterium]